MRTHGPSVEMARDRQDLTTTGAYVLLLPNCGAVKEASLTGDVVVLSHWQGGIHPLTCTRNARVIIDITGQISRYEYREYVD